MPSVQSLPEVRHAESGHQFRLSDKVREKNANCAGQKVNCAGNCAGLRNLASNKLFHIPLPVKVNIEFSL